MPFAILVIMAVRLLVFGDSMTHRGSDSAPEQAEVSATPAPGAMPGDVMASALMARGTASAGRLDARVGRSAYNFWRRETAESLIKADLAWQPDVVIVFLGTNDIGLNMGIDEKSMRAIRDWLGSQGARVFAIGPPSFADPERQKGTTTVVQMMRRVFGPRFIDARPLTTDLTTTGRAGDLIHFTSVGSKVVGARLAQAVEGALRWDFLRRLGTVAVTATAPVVALVWQSRS